MEEEGAPLGILDEGSEEGRRLVGLEEEGTDEEGMLVGDEVGLDST